MPHKTVDNCCLEAVFFLGRGFPFCCNFAANFILVVKCTASMYYVDVDVGLVRIYVQSMYYIRLSNCVYTYNYSYSHNIHEHMVTMFFFHTLYHSIFGILYYPSPAINMFVFMSNENFHGMGFLSLIMVSLTSIVTIQMCCLAMTYCSKYQSVYFSYKISKYIIVHLLISCNIYNFLYHAYALNFARIQVCDLYIPGTHIH